MRPHSAPYNKPSSQSECETPVSQLGQAGMPHTLPVDLPRLDAIAPDLLGTTPTQRWTCLLRPFAALACYAVVAVLRLWWLIPIVMFFVFISSVTATHDVVHGALGLKRRQTECALFVLGALLLESGHAYRATHLQHHRVFPDHNDIEGEPAHFPPLRTLLMGPFYLPRLWRWAWKHHHAHPDQRAWLVAEACLPFAGILLGVALWPFTPGVLLYALLVIGGSWIYPLVTANLQHRVDQPTPLLQSSTLRGHILPVLFLNLTYHLEHHLYPHVPSHHVAELSRRLDPLLRAQGVRPSHVP